MRNSGQVNITVTKTNILPSKVGDIKKPMSVIVYYGYSTKQ